MQFAVPQFTDVEDKLIGPLTLKQFFMLLATGGIDLFFWSILHFSIFFFFFAIPVALLGLGLAFGKYNGRPMYVYLGSFISFFSKPQARIFRREEPDGIIQVVPKPKQITAQTDSNALEPAESRLRKLAYLLDQKTHEEEELISRSK